MKTKKSSFAKAFLSKKRFAVVQIAIVLCSVLLVTIPAIAAEQNQEMQKTSANTITTASEDDFVLGVYGNANEDDTIDMGDVVYTKLAIFGKKPKTELCDAKYDGRINVLDVIQTKLIILGKEKELTIVDTPGRIVTVNKPIERIAAVNGYCLPILRALGATDKIVAVSYWTVKRDPIFYPEFSDYPDVGGFKSPNYEEILNCNADAVVLLGTGFESEMEAIEVRLKDLNPNIAVLRFDGNTPYNHVSEARILGYILDKREQAKEWTDFYEGVLNPIKAEVGSIENKKKVYIEWWKAYFTTAQHTGCHWNVETAGGENIFSDLYRNVEVDKEEVMRRNPDVIVRVGGGGYDTDDITELIDIRDEIMSRPELAKVTAVKDGHVYIINRGIMDSTAHFVGIAYLAKWFYPELFEDLDPKAIHQEYLTRFQGLDFDLDKKGVFVYPELS